MSTQPGPSTQAAGLRSGHRHTATHAGPPRGHPPPAGANADNPRLPTGHAPAPSGTPPSPGSHRTEADPGTTTFLGGPKNEITDVSAGHGKLAQRIRWHGQQRPRAPDFSHLLTARRRGPPAPAPRRTFP